MMDSSDEVLFYSTSSQNILTFGKITNFNTIQSFT